MKNQIISGILSAVMCIAPVAVPYASSINASAVSTAIENETLAEYAQRVYEIVNEERIKNGLNPVTFNPQLNSVANIRAEEIIDYYGHSRPDGSTWNTVFDENNISVGACGENILAMGYIPPIPETAMSAWLDSQIHHDNIMNATYTQIGVGVAQEGDNYYIVQLISTEAISWNISGNTLIISGTGSTPSYDPDNRAWNDSIDTITEVSIENTITETGRYLFCGIENLKSATLPASVKKVDYYTFYGCSALEEVIFRNPECEIEGSTETIPANAVICGYENSTAQEFAEKYGYSFRIIEDVFGDVDGDGKVSAVDASAVSMEYALLSTSGVGTFTDKQNKSGDIDGDGKISAIDASYISSYYAYLSTGGTEKDMKKWLENF